MLKSGVGKIRGASNQVTARAQRKEGRHLGGWLAGWHWSLQLIPAKFQNIIRKQHEQDAEHHKQITTHCNVGK